MGGPLSVIISNIFMAELEKKVVMPEKPAFYKHFVDDIITCRKKNQPDELFSKLNSFPVEVNPHFNNDSVCGTRFFRKLNEVPLH